MKGVCPICKSPAVATGGEYRHAHAVFAGMQRMHCTACGMGYANPFPADSALEQYNASYFDSAHGGLSRNAVTTAFFSGVAGLRAAHVDRYLERQGIAVAHVREIGPGHGFFAGRWMRNHPGTSYSAVETDSSCHAALRQIGVQLLSPHSPAVETGPIDLVVISHVLEHVSNPAAFVAEMTADLRPNGALFIEVPCRDWEHKALDEPHLLFFDKEPMRRLLNELGFEQIEVTYHGRQIQQLRSPSMIRSRWMSVRNRLLSAGIVAPFARVSAGLEVLDDPLERAAVRPLEAHRESAEPAWWLRAVARKKAASPG